MNRRCVQFHTLPENLRLIVIASAVAFVPVKTGTFEEHYKRVGWRGVKGNVETKVMQEINEYFLFQTVH